MKVKTDRFMWLKSIKENKSSYYYWGYLSIIGIIFYIMNCYTPLFLDDWQYNLIFGSNQVIKSISDIFESQYTHYFQQNGRFIPHFIIQFFDAITGKEWFNIANSLIFVLFICLVPKTVISKSYNIILTSVYLFIIIIFTEYFGECFLWMSGACNYLWSATIWLIFHYILSLQIKDRNLYPLLLLLGIISGWTQEAFILGIAGGYLLYFLLNKEQITPSRLWLLFGFYLGVILLVLSPANINRANNSGAFTPSFMGYFWTIVSFKNISIIYILFIAIGYSLYKKYISPIKFIKENIFIISSLLFTICFIIAIRGGSPRSHFGIEFLSSILLLRVIAQFKFKKTFILYLNLILLLVTIPIINTARANYVEYLSLIEKIKTTNNTIIGTNEIKVNPLIDKYIIKPYTSEYSEFYSGYNHAHTENIFIAKRFNKEKIIFLPESFLSIIKNEPEQYTKFNIPTVYSFYAKEITENTINKVTYKFKDTDFDSLPFYIKPFAQKLSRYSLNSLDTDKWAIVTINNKNYLIVGRNWMLDKRLENIVYE